MGKQIYELWFSYNRFMDKLMNLRVLLLIESWSAIRELGKQRWGDNANRVTQHLRANRTHRYLDTQSWFWKSTHPTTCNSCIRVFHMRTILELIYSNTTVAIGWGFKTMVWWFGQDEVHGELLINYNDHAMQPNRTCLKTLQATVSCQSRHGI